ncbi:MAG: hypothetical protein HFG20_08355 [Anaerotruncus sp.]|nr:hypothetical protein [Anaerotruncus sp.]
MRKQVAAILAALALLFLCDVKVFAQQMITLPAGGLRRLDFDVVERALGKDFFAASITLPPAQQQGVLYLDGLPLQPGQVLTRAQLERVLLFSSKKQPFISFGMTAFPERQPQGLRIRCINPQFEAHTKDKS